MDTMLEKLAVWTDDSELLHRASAPQREWYPRSSHAGALQPLAWLVALLPIAISYIRLPWTDAAAQWGLRGLGLLSTYNWSDYLNPAAKLTGDNLSIQPPLMTWLTAIGMTLLGPDHPWVVVLISNLCAFSIVILSLYLARDLGGAWQAVLTCIFVATHPVMPYLAQSPTASTLALTGSLLTIWSFYRHLETRAIVWSRWMWPAVLGLAAMLLTNGALAAVTILILFTFVLISPRLETGTRRIMPVTRRTGHAYWRETKSLFVCLAAGVTLGGWWAGLMFLQYSREFLAPWLGITSEATSTLYLHASDLPWYELRTWFRLTGALLPLMSGFMVLGGYRLVRIVFREPASNLLRPHVFLLVWTSISILVWGLSLVRIQGMSLDRFVWTVLMIIPLSLLAAEGFNEIGERRAGFTTVLAVFAFGILVLISRFRALLLDPAEFTHQLILALLLCVVFSLLFWLAFRFIWGHEIRQTLVVRWGTWTLILCHCLWNLSGISHRQWMESSEPERALLQFWQDLRMWKAANPLSPDAPGDVILMTNAKPTDRLQYVVQSLWPRREFHQVQNWESMTRWVPTAGPRLLVVYGERQMIRPSSPGDSSTLAPVVPPRIYRRGELSAYEWKK